MLFGYLNNLNRLSHFSTAIEFGESDVYIREREQRPVAVERLNLLSPLAIKIYAITIEGYEQHTLSAFGCNLTLRQLGINEAQIDKAEGYYILNYTTFLDIHINLNVFYIIFFR